MGQKWSALDVFCFYEISSFKIIFQVFLSLRIPSSWEGIGMKPIVLFPDMIAWLNLVPAWRD